MAGTTRVERVSLAGVLDEAIKNAGLTRKEIALKIGISVPQLARLAKGTRRFPKAKLEQLFESLPSLRDSFAQGNLLSTMSTQEALEFLKKLDSWGLRRDHFDFLGHSEPDRSMIVALIRRLTEAELLLYP